MAKRLVIQRLVNLTALRSRLVDLQKAIKTPIKESMSFMNKSLHLESVKLSKNSMQAIDSDLKQINLLLNSIVKDDKHLYRLTQIITSVPGVGIVTALHIIITTNEFIDIHNPRQFASYAGVAPFPQESGTIQRRRKISSLANKKLKSLLHICVLMSKKTIPEITAYYIRKTQVEGKAKMSVINAIRNKIILRIFSCVKQDRLYQKDFSHEFETQLVLKISKPCMFFHVSYMCFN
ncbi:transposase [Mucilaginibacter sp. UYCu711]|uniref:transposase n=1 Tax=Mucilaginibacter sp. UYCu711 TaxID=3156339 RepID=UPI003D204387